MKHHTLKKVGKREKIQRYIILDKMTSVPSVLQSPSHRHFIKNFQRGILYQHYCSFVLVFPVLRTVRFLFLVDSGKHHFCSIKHPRDSIQNVKRNIHYQHHLCNSDVSDMSQTTYPGAPHMRLLLSCAERPCFQETQARKATRLFEGAAEPKVKSQPAQLFFCIITAINQSKAQAQQFNWCLFKVERGGPVQVLF